MSRISNLGNYRASIVMLQLYINCCVKAVLNLSVVLLPYGC